MSAREYRHRPDDVIARRIESAAAKPSGRPVDGAGNRAMALLSIIPGGDCGPDARRAVARYLARSCGCRGWKCGYGEHAGRLSVRDEIMSALGLDGGERR